MPIWGLEPVPKSGYDSRKRLKIWLRIRAHNHNISTPCVRDISSWNANRNIVSLFSAQRGKLLRFVRREKGGGPKSCASMRCIAKSSLWIEKWLLGFVIHFGLSRAEQTQHSPTITDPSRHISTSSHLVPHSSPIEVQRPVHGLRHGHPRQGKLAEGHYRPWDTRSNLSGMRKWRDSAQHSLLIYQYILHFLCFRDMFESLFRSSDGRCLGSQWNFDDHVEILMGHRTSPNRPLILLSWWRREDYGAGMLQDASVAFWAFKVQALSNCLTKVVISFV